MTDEEMAGGLTDEQMMASSPPAAPKRRGYAEPKSFRASDVDLGIEDPLAPTQARGVTDTATGPVLSYMDRASFGALGGALRMDQRLAENPIARAVDAIPIIGPIIGKRRGETAQRSLDAMEGYREAHPTLSRWTDLPAVVSGPSRAVAEGAAQIGGNIGRFASAGNPLADLFKTALPAGAVSGVASGSESFFHGDDPEQVAQSALAGAQAGTELGGVAAGGARLAGEAGRAVASTRGAKAREFIESRGGEVGLTTPGKGRAFEDMVTRGTSDADIGHQAEVSTDKGLGILRQEHRAVKGGIGAQKRAIADTPAAARMHDVGDVVTKLNETLEDLDLSDYAEGHIRKALDKITKKQGQGFNPDTDNYLLSETDVNKLRKRLDKAAKTGDSTDESLQPLKEAAKMVRDIVDQGPYADVNKRFHDEFTRYQGAREQLGINPKPKKTNETKADKNIVRNLIGREGQNTITAGGQRQRFGEFKEENPYAAAEFEKPELLRKRADISFHLLPQKHGGLIDRTGSAVGGVAMAELAMHALQHGHVPTPQALGALALGLGVQNLPALQARLLYGPALAAQAAEPLLLNQVPLLAAGKRMNQEEAR